MAPQTPTWSVQIALAAMRWAFLFLLVLAALLITPLVRAGLHWTLLGLLSMANIVAIDVLVARIVVPKLVQLEQEVALVNMQSKHLIVYSWGALDSIKTELLQNMASEAGVREVTIASQG
jgi:hypothetical protein